jgi:hypothetical protein
MSARQIPPQDPGSRARAGVLARDRRRGRRKGSVT